MKQVDKHHPDAHRIEEECEGCRGTGETKYAHCPKCNGTGTNTVYVAPEEPWEEARLEEIQEMHEEYTV